MKAVKPIDEYEDMEHALQRLIWTEHKKFAQLLDHHALSLPRFLVLFSIKRRGAGCPIGKLAEEMYQSYATMTDIVDRLEDQKLVVRDRIDPKDRRKVMVDLTPTGHNLLERANQARRERMVRALASFSAEDRRHFLRLLNTFLEALEKESE
jgi:DNA-binding MarR family transcriptional regulator